MTERLAYAITKESLDACIILNNIYRQWGFLCILRRAEIQAPQKARLSGMNSGTGRTPPSSGKTHSANTSECTEPLISTSAEVAWDPQDLQEERILHEAKKVDIIIIIDPELIRSYTKQGKA